MRSFLGTKQMYTIAPSGYLKRSSTSSVQLMQYIISYSSRRSSQLSWLKRNQTNTDRLMVDDQSSPRRRQEGYVRPYTPVLQSKGGRPARTSRGGSIYGIYKACRANRAFHCTFISLKHFLVSKTVADASSLSLKEFRLDEGLGNTNS